MAETDLWFGTLSATVRVEDLPASRQVVAIERQANGDWRVCGQAVSNAEGIATLPITGLPTSRIYAIAIDEWGKPFAPGMPVAYGDVIRPTQFLGWMYQVTSPGVLPGTEPEWWNSMAGVPQPVGTAMMQAVRHYQPVAHGPVSDIEWEERELDEFWENVIFYAPFTSDFKDYSNRRVPTSVVGSCFIDSSDGAAGNGCLVAPGASYVAAAVDAKFADRDFTIECFVRSDSTLPMFAGLAGFEGSLGADHALMTATITNTALGQGSLWVSSTGSSWNVLDNAPFAPLNDGVWHHLAFTRTGGSLRAFLDGQLKHTVPVSGSLPQKGPMSIFGKKLDGLGHANTVRVQHARITDDIARYTESFTPPSIPFHRG